MTDTMVDECQQCGHPCANDGDHPMEPWPEEWAWRFRTGEGCPECNWGRCCPFCKGAGTDGRPDPVRGWAVVTTITCVLCDGEGTLTAQFKAQT